MNLFITSEFPMISAKNLDDRRVGKALIECCQMMSVAIKIHSKETIEVGPTQLTRGWMGRNHPVTLWVCANKGNYEWTWFHAEALASEFIYRFGSHGHASADRLEHLWKKRICLPEGGQLPFCNMAKNAGLGLDFTHLPVPESYQAYLNERWRLRSPTFTRREAPEWKFV